MKEEAQQLEKEQKRREQAQKLIVGIQKVFALTYQDFKDKMLRIRKIHNNTDSFLSYNDASYNLQLYISDKFGEEKQRILAKGILVRMNILREDKGAYAFYLELLMNNYKVEWNNASTQTNQFLCNVLEKLVKEFSDDTHLETVIEILKDID